MTVDEALSRLREAYAALESYSDTAEVSLELREDGKTITHRGKSVIVFKSPNRFLVDLEWTDIDGRGMVAIQQKTYVSDGGTHRSCWVKHESQRGPRVRVEELWSAQQCFATGPFPMSPLIVPMLTEDPGWSRIPFDEATIGREQINGRDVLVVSGRSAAWKDEHLSLWIDLEDYLLRRIVVESGGNGPDATARTVVDITPRPNADLPDSAFRLPDDEE